MTRLHKFGRNPVLEMNVEETIWAVGGIYEFPTKDGSLSIVSDDANDTSDGTGLRTVLIQGLDIGYDPLEETVTLNGTTPVETESHFFRVNRLRGITAGSSGRNEGLITLSSPSQGIALACIEIGLGQSQLGFYTPAANTIVEINDVFIYPFKSQAAFFEIRMFLRQFEEAWNLKGTFGGHTQGSEARRLFNPPFALPAKSDLEFRGTVSANNVGLSVEFSGNIQQR